jgi:hypothetical protein
MRTVVRWWFDQMEQSISGGVALTNTAGERVSLRVVLLALIADKAAFVDVLGIVGSGIYGDIGQEIKYSDMRDPVQRQISRHRTLQRCIEMISKGVHGREGVPVEVNGMRAAAVRLELESRGISIGNQPVSTLRPQLREQLQGYKCLPACLGSTVSECKSKLVDELFRQLLPYPDPLHDCKGVGAKLHVEIYSRQTTATKQHMVEEMTKHGAGPDRTMMTGSVWRRVFAAFHDVYGECTPRQQEIMETCSMLREGLYNTPEEYTQARVLHYALLCIRFEVLTEAEFGDGKMKSKVTSTSLFGRYYKGVLDGAINYRLSHLWVGLTERFEELFARIKKLVGSSFCPGDLARSVLNMLRLRSGIQGASQEARRTSTPSGSTENVITNTFIAGLSKKYGEASPQVAYFRRDPGVGVADPAGGCAPRLHQLPD